MSALPEPVSTAAPSLIHALREISATAPSTTAVITDGELLGFGDLWAASGRLAARLRADGVRAESLVAVDCPRTAEQIIAVAAIHRAGGAAVLLDPGWPQARREQLLGELPVRLVVDRATVRRPHAYAGSPRADAPDTLDALAFVVYTSGSTGRPKAVGIPHRSVVHCAHTHARSHRITAGSRHGWVTSTGSSAGIGEVWPALVTGACVVAATDADLESAPAMRDWVLRERITHLFAPTALARLLVTLNWPEDTPLRIMSIGGEAARQWAPRSLPFAVTVDYGSAEANGVSSGLARPDLPLSAAEAPRRYRDGVPPIGLPWPDVEVHVVDAALREVSADERGELVVRSPELARGYLNDPAETARRFVPDPFGPPGSRLLRTGDLVNRDAKGVLFFHGRCDDVVQVRGANVALAEVEEAVHAVLGCEQVAAVGIESADQTRLGVVVAGQVDSSAWRSQLNAALPAHLVPSELVSVARLPLLPNRKLDRHAAAELLRAARPTTGSPSAPRNADPTLRALLAVWRAVMPAGHDDPDADFYLSGGTSLNLVSLATAVELDLGVRLRVADVLRNPSPRELADVVRARGSVHQPATPCPAEVPTELPLHPAQRSLWLAAQQDPTGCGYNEVIPLLLDGLLDPDALRNAWTAVLGRHSALRTRFPVGTDGLPYQVVAEDPAPDFAVATLDVRVDETRAQALTRAIAESYGQPFRLADRAPVRARLWLLPDAALFVITAHHIVVDADSGEQIVDELLALYQGGAAVAALSAEPKQFASCPLPPVPDAALAAAVTRFGAWPEPIKPPAARPLPLRRKEYSGARMSAELAGPAVLALRDRVPRWRVTPLAVAIASVQLLLAGTAGEEEVCVGTPVSVRDLCGGAGVVGPLLNTVLVRNRVPRGEGLGAAVAEVRMALLAATEQSGIPFDEFVRAASLPERVRRQPVQFYVNMNYARATHRVGRLSCTRLPFDPLRSHYDLRFELNDTGSGVSAVLEYDDQRYDERSAAEVLRHWVTLIERGLAEPDLPATRMPAAPSTPASPADPEGMPDRPDPAPTDALAEAVSQAWRETFGIAEFDPVEDTFFALGGTSLIAAQLAMRMTVRLGIEVSLITLFEAPTVAATCALLRERHPEVDTMVAAMDALWSAEPRSVAPEPTPLAAPAAARTARMSSGQEQLWISAQLRRQQLTIPVLLTIDGPLDAERLRAALREVAGRQEAWRTGFEVRDGAPMQVIHLDAEPPLRIVDVPDRDRERWFAQDSAERERIDFDLARPPLVDATLYRFGPAEHRLLLVIHHIVFDGGSALPMLRELDAFYRGVPGELVPLRLSYREFADRQRAELTAERQAELAVFWRRQLAGGPRDRQAPPATSKPARAQLPADLLGTLREFAAAHNATVFQVLLAALHVLVARRVGSRDVTIGVPTSYRSYRGSEHLIGYFLNMVPIRVRAEPGADFATLVSATRASTLAGFVRGRLPYPLIKKAAPHTLDAVLAIGPVHRGLRIGDATVDLDVRNSGNQAGALSLAVLEDTDRVDLELVGGSPANLLEEYLTILRRAVTEPWLAVPGNEAEHGNPVG